MNITIIKKIKYIDLKKLKIGEILLCKVIITNKIHNKFCKLSGDNSPIHNNLNFCKKNGYNKIVGYGFLIHCILSKIYGTIFPGGNEICLKQDGNFINPYFVGDELLIKIKVIYKNLDLRLINLSTEFFRKKTKIFYGESTLQLVLSKNEL